MLTIFDIRILDGGTCRGIMKMFLETLKSTSSHWPFRRTKLFSLMKYYQTCILDFWDFGGQVLSKLVIAKHGISYYNIFMYSVISSTLCVFMSYMFSWYVSLYPYDQPSIRYEYLEVTIPTLFWDEFLRCDQCLWTRSMATSYEDLAAHSWQGSTSDTWAVKSTAQIWRP